MSFIFHNINIIKVRPIFKANINKRNWRNSSPPPIYATNPSPSTRGYQLDQTKGAFKVYMKNNHSNNNNSNKNNIIIIYSGWPKKIYKLLGSL